MNYFARALLFVAVATCLSCSGPTAPSPATFVIDGPSTMGVGLSALFGFTEKDAPANVGLYTVHGDMGNGDQFVFQYGDGLPRVRTVSNVASYPAPGTYIVTATIVDTAGNSFAASKAVNVF